MICYFDTSMVLKLLVDDEDVRDHAERLWRVATAVLCVEIGYVEARAALAAVHRSGRLRTRSFATAKCELDRLWEQLAVVVVDTTLVRAAAELAETARLRGYDAVHLAAARRCGADVVVTADRQLASAALTHGLAVAGAGTQSAGGAPK
ncbi:MAG TPA: type II toxin-antitoxin system VapC family toxin [Miltoncostaeales bacterium]|nr:type II toxin-antitoxin system VapC family toxin [Miltoncostaeales bacterium]